MAVSCDIVKCFPLKYFWLTSSDVMASAVVKISISIGSRHAVICVENIVSLTDIKRVNAAVSTVRMIVTLRYQQYISQEIIQD
jgi:hypothetical protein